LESSKVCGHCKVAKSLDQFYVRNEKGREGKPDSACKECRSYLQKKRRNFRNDFKRPSEPIIDGDVAYIWVRDKSEWLQAIIDIEDLEKVQKYCWYKHESGYAIASINGTRVRMHRFILGLTQYDGVAVVDHINRNCLDNQKVNLRVTDQSTNITNVSKPRRDNKSGYRGVSKNGAKWSAYFQWKGKEHSRHGFNDSVAAALAYDDLVRTYGPPLAYLNFPERRP
jgi:hypothetical protein